MASRLCVSSLCPAPFLFLLLPALLLLRLPTTVKGDCWLIEGDKGYVWLAICSQNQPPYETIPQHINSTVSMSLSILRPTATSIKLCAFMHSEERWCQLRRICH